MKKKRTYGGRFGSPGAPEDKERCIEEVRSKERWCGGHQCSNKRGHGPNGEYCKTHANKLERDKLCWRCKGSGKCDVCNGDGKYTCSHCGTKEIDCYLCDKDGVCTSCEGTGKAKR